MRLELKSVWRAMCLAGLTGLLGVSVVACSKDDIAAESGSITPSGMAPQQTGKEQQSLGTHAGITRVMAADPVALAHAAQTDPVAARDWGGLHALCAGVELRSARGSSLPAAWRAYEQACARLAPSLQSARAVEVKPFDHPDVRRLAALEALPEEDPMREQGLAEVMRTSSVAAFRTDAAMSLLTSKRLREWGGEVLPPLLVDNTLALQIDASLLYGCKIGLDCAPYSFSSLGECALTSPCSPGTPLQQVIELRHSPQELHLLRNVVDRLVEIGGQ